MTSETPMPRTDRFTKIYLLLWALCIILAVVALIFYKFGYRLTSNFAPTKIGTIEISSNQSGLKMFLNNREKKPLDESGRYVIRNVIPGVHALIISKDGFWPWSKTFQLNDSETRAFYSFLFPMKGIAVFPLEKGVEYEQALKFFKTAVLPELKSGSLARKEDESLTLWLEKNVPNYKISSDKSTALFTENSTVRIAWISETKPLARYFCQENPCRLEIPVIVSNLPLGNVDFYKDRNDVIIFAAGAAIYGIEVDRDGTQNFQPLYKGVNPIFYKANDELLYIKDGGSLLRAKL